MDSPATAAKVVSGKPLLTRAGRPAESFNRKSRRAEDRCEDAKRPADLIDARLAVAARDGDEIAFVKIVRRHQPWLCRVLRRRGENEEDTYDALQDVLFSAWRNLGRYDPERSFKVWLYHIALNKCRDRARRALTPWAGVEMFIAQTYVETSSTASPEVNVLKDQTLQRLSGAIDQLPPELKRALTVSALNDRSQIEAARMLRITRKAVENKVRRAKELLAGMLRASDLVDLLGATTTFARGEECDVQRNFSVLQFRVGVDAPEELWRDRWQSAGFDRG